MKKKKSKGNPALSETASNLYDWAELIKAGNERLNDGVFAAWECFRDYAWEYRKLAARSTFKSFATATLELQQAYQYLARMQSRISATYARIYREKKARPCKVEEDRAAKTNGNS